MKDSEIIGLFFDRSERAVSCLDKQYGGIFRKLAYSLLSNKEDADECVNDAYLGVWNTVPPKRPEPLVPYVCRIVRNIAVDKIRRSSAHKRGGLNISLEELGDNIFSSNKVEDELDTKELSIALNGFLSTLDKDDRILFVRRYWYCDSVKAVAKLLGITANNASVRLSRLRNDLKEYLKQKGVEV